MDRLTIFKNGVNKQFFHPLLNGEDLYSDLMYCILEATKDKIVRSIDRVTFKRYIENFLQEFHLQYDMIDICEDKERFDAKVLDIINRLISANWIEESTDLSNNRVLTITPLCIDLITFLTSIESQKEQNYMCSIISIKNNLQSSDTLDYDMIYHIQKETKTLAMSLKNLIGVMRKELQSLLYSNKDVQELNEWLNEGRDNEIHKLFIALQTKENSSKNILGIKEMIQYYLDDYANNNASSHLYIIARDNLINEGNADIPDFTGEIHNKARNLELVLEEIKSFFEDDYVEIINEATLTYNLYIDKVNKQISLLTMYSEDIKDKLLKGLAQTLETDNYDISDYIYLTGLDIFDIDSLNKPRIKEIKAQFEDTVEELSLEERKEKEVEITKRMLDRAELTKRFKRDNVKKRLESVINAHKGKNTIDLQDIIKTKDDFMDASFYPELLEKDLEGYEVEDTDYEKTEYGIIKGYKLVRKA